VRKAIGLPSGPIRSADVADLTNLDLVFQSVGNSPPDYASPPSADSWITSLVGIECIPSLTAVSVDPFMLDLSPLASLPNLTTLWFGPVTESAFPSLPQVTTLTAQWSIGQTALALMAFPSLTSLDVANADFSTPEALAALSTLTNLTALTLASSSLTTTAPLSTLAHLHDLNLSHNEVQDLAGLSALTTLVNVVLDDNKVTDIEPLVANPSFAAGRVLSVASNPLVCQSQSANIAALRARGVTVSSDCP
jgi:hypothetical protein